MISTYLDSRFLRPRPAASLWLLAFGLILASVTALGAQESSAPQPIRTLRGTTRGAEIPRNAIRAIPAPQQGPENGSPHPSSELVNRSPADMRSEFAAPQEQLPSLADTTEPKEISELESESPTPGTERTDSSDPGLPVLPLSWTPADHAIRDAQSASSAPRWGAESPTVSEPVSDLPRALVRTDESPRGEIPAAFYEPASEPKLLGDFTRANASPGSADGPGAPTSVHDSTDEPNDRHFSRLGAVSTVAAGSVFGALLFVAFFWGTRHSPTIPSVIRLEIQPSDFLTTFGQRPESLPGRLSVDAHIADSGTVVVELGDSGLPLGLGLKSTVADEQRRKTEGDRQRAAEICKSLFEQNLQLQRALETA